MNQETAPPTPKTSNKWAVLAVMLLILLVGAFLRFYRLNSLPPGLFIDEAINGLDAQGVWRNGNLPIFFPANNGREPLYIYLQAIALALIGENGLSMRLVSAYIGMITIPVVYVLSKTLFLKTTPGAVWIGVTASAALAASYWHVSLSRLGFRTILLPLFVMLVLLWFWMGWQRRKLRWFVLAGIALGISQYTYLASRAVPVLFAGFVGLILLGEFSRHKQITPTFKLMLKSAFFMSVIALLIYMPLGIYLLTTPSGASARTADVSLLSPAAANGESVEMALINNAVLVGRMFVDRGDMNLRHNLPGRAALDALNVVGFVTGLFLLLRHRQRAQSWLLVLWLIIMLLPTLLATEAPHYLRASGALGAVMIVVGMGLVWWWERLEIRLQKQGWLKRPFHFWLLLPLLVLMFSATLTAFDYFARWANAPHLYDDFQAVESQAANAVLQKLAEGSVYLIPDIAAQRSPVLQLFLNFTAVRQLPSECLVFQPQAPTPVIYMVRTQRDEETLPQLQALLPGGEVETAVFHPDSGEIFFETYTITPEENGSRIKETAVAQFGDAIQLTGTETQLADNAIPITITWQAISQPTADHTLFIHLYRVGEEDEPAVAQLDIQPCYPTGKWQPGEALRETYTLPLPPDLPPGDYTVGLGWYTWPSFERLPLEMSDNQLSNQRHVLGQITIGD